MCGIAGIFDLQSERLIDRDALHRMTDALVHRGPDEEGFFEAPGIGLGHRRLAIIDRGGGKQPYQAQNGAIVAFNGEVYNFQELALELQRSGLALKTRSDVEVLSEGISLYGEAYLQQVRGMYAFASWNSQHKRVDVGSRPPG